MRYRVAVVVAGLFGWIGVPGPPAAAAAASETVTVPVHCVMPITPRQINEFDVDLSVDLVVAGPPTTGEAIAIDASVGWVFAPNPSEFVVVLGGFDLALTATGAHPNDIRITGPEQALPPGAGTVNPIAELQTVLDVTAAPGEEFVIAARRFTYPLRISGGGPLVTCDPIGGPVKLYSAPTLAPVGANCKGVANTITGTNRADVLVGTEGDDVINAGAGNDRVFGRGGNDLICGSHGDDELMGGTGVDRLYGEGGRDTLLGGADDDIVHGGGQTDACQSGLLSGCESSLVSHPVRVQMACRIWLSRVPPTYLDFNIDVGARVVTSGPAEAGREIVVDASFESAVPSPLGNTGPYTVLMAGTGFTPIAPIARGPLQQGGGAPIAEVQFAATATGATGSVAAYDLLNVNYQIQTPAGTAAAAGCNAVAPAPSLFDATILAATPTCKGAVVSIAGSPNDDVIVGTAGDDVIQAGAGDDLVFGLGGNDRICGSHGDDVVLGGSGEDHLYGEGGRDVVRGGADYDWVHGGGATDRCASGLPVSCESFAT